MTIFDYITDTSSVESRNAPKYWEIERPSTGFGPVRLINALVRIVVRLFERASR